MQKYKEAIRLYIKNKKKIYIMHAYMENKLDGLYLFCLLLCYIW